jgi:hypothetical protein
MNLTLSEYAGQGCDVIITIRRDGSSYVMFQSNPIYGHPILEKEKLKNLLDKIELLEKEDWS